MAKYPDVTAGQTEACINRLGGWDNFLRFIGGSGEVVFNSTLTLLSTIYSPAQPKVTTSMDFWEQVGVRRVSEGPEIQTILNRSISAPAMKLATHKLEDRLSHTAILRELGAKARMPLAQVAAFLDADRGSEGLLLFYPEEIPGLVLCASWPTGFRTSFLGWYLRSHLIEKGFRPEVGSVVVSRN